MDFIKQVDELSDDEKEITPNNSSSFIQSNEFNRQLAGLPFHQQPKHNTSFQFQGIKSIDVPDEDYNAEPDQGFNTFHQSNTSYTSADASSNIIHHSVDKSHQLISTNLLSDKTRNIFNFAHFNPMQSKCFSSIYQQDHNCVISSPTGSGKTVLFELAILRLLNTQGSTENIKILYIAPTKALCIERQNDWNNRFSTFGLRVGTLTSDTGFLETDKVKKANIIITTPEKWDLMTRKWADYSKLFGLIKLLLIDEVHILRENRGSTLEVVVTRMKKICHSIRIIALSATVPNIHDVSSWINLNSISEVSALTLVFGEEYRPVKLEKKVYGYKQTANNWVFDVILNQKLVENLSQFNKNRKPVLIFCPTRNSTMSTAKYITTHYNGLSSNNVINARDKDLKEYSVNGVSFHHAGLSIEDRLSVEQGFLSGKIRILCCTSTLAVGVNLPAYLVIIKGTKIWNTNHFEEYSELDILQMMGRAGRPQFEKEALAIVMTSSEKQTHYENFIKGNEKLESRLHLNLHENIVSETYLKTITSLEEAVSWLKHTFFYSRYKSNPTAYNEIPFSYQLGMDERLMKYCEAKIRELINFQLIKIEDKEYECTAFGEAMTKHYVFFETMKTFMKSPANQTIADILTLVSKAKEFETIRLKRTEKRLFKEINDSPIMKYPLKATTTVKTSKKKTSKSIEQNYEKIYILIQYELGGIEYPNDSQLMKIQQAFKQDKFYVIKHVGRLIRCLLDCFIEKKDYISLNNCLTLARCISGGCWEDTPMILKQLDNVGIVTVRRFANHNIGNFKQLKDFQSNRIEYCGCLKPGQGMKILNQLENLPKLSISSTIVKAYKSKNDQNTVVIKLKVSISLECKLSRWNNRPLTVVVVSGLSNGELVDFRRTGIHRIQGEKSFGLEVLLRTRGLSLSHQIFCAEIAGVKESFVIDLNQSLDRNLLDQLPALGETKKSILLYPGCSQIILNSLSFTNIILFFSDEETQTGSNKELFENDDDGSKLEDDSELESLMVQSSKMKGKNLENNTVVQSKSYDVKRTHGDLTCKHTCKDKTKCRHLCCREGLAPPAPKRSKSKEPEDIQNHGEVTANANKFKSSFDVLHKLTEHHEQVKASKKQRTYEEYNSSKILTKRIDVKSFGHCEERNGNIKPVPKTNSTKRIIDLDEEDTYETPDKIIEGFSDDADDEILRRLKEPRKSSGKQSKLLITEVPTTNREALNNYQVSLEFLVSSKGQTMSKDPKTLLSKFKKPEATKKKFLDDSFESDEELNDAEFVRFLNMPKKPPLIKSKPKVNERSPEKQNDAITTKVTKQGNVESKTEKSVDYKSIIEIFDDATTTMDKSKINSSYSKTFETTKASDYSTSENAGTSHSDYANKYEPLKTAEFNGVIECIQGNEIAASSVDDLKKGLSISNDFDAFEFEYENEYEYEYETANMIQPTPKEDADDNLLDVLGVDIGLNEDGDIDSMFGSDVEVV